MNRFCRAMATLPLAAVIAGCGARGEPPPTTLPPVDAGTVQLPDSLVLTLPGGNTIWLTEGRRSADSTGKECVERSIEVRRESYRLKVPLLYTLDLPTPLDDTSFKAELYRGCLRMDSYRVLVRDGMPYKLPQ
jgi:hypothetical protein